MKEILEEALALAIAMIFVIAIALTWYCAVAVSWDIFMPIAGLLTALAAVILLVGRKTND